MQSVRREEILDYQTYVEQRDSVRNQALNAKESRRIHVGENLTFLFENRDTVRYQVQEMMRAEQIVKEADIQHELDTYNDILGGDGELGCTLLIEIDDPKIRDVKLREYLDLPDSCYVELENGERVGATFDARQKGKDRVSSVQFLKFNTKGQTPVAVGVDFSAIQARTALREAQRKALETDLAS